jgi:hypothetical protein
MRCSHHLCHKKHVMNKLLIINNSQTYIEVKILLQKSHRINTVAFQLITVCYPTLTITFPLAFPSDNAW